MRNALPIAILFILVIAFRIFGSWIPESFPNFQPVAALFFCAALISKSSKAWIIAALAWLISYPAPALFAGNSAWLNPVLLLTTAAAFAATYFLGRSFSGQNFVSIIGGAALAAIAFHVITNGLAWIGSPLYSKDVSGLYQSLWSGPPLSNIPSWVFLRNMMAANILFTAIFLSANFRLPVLRRASVLNAAK